jgi:hypothetical protein
MPDDLKPNGTGADTTWTPAPASDTPPAWWTDPKTDPKGDTPPANELVPSWRLKEEADKRREVETKLKEYETKETEREKKNLEKQGKYKELLDASSKEIETLKSQVAVIGEYDTAITGLVDVELTAIKTALGEEKFTKITTLLNLDSLSALQKLQALPKLKELVGEFWEKKPEAKWGHSISHHDTNTYDKAKSTGDFNGMLGAIIQWAIKT